MEILYNDDRSNLGIINDPYIKIKPGKFLKNYLLNNNSNINLDSNHLLTFNNVQKLYDEIQQKNKSEMKYKTYLNELLIDSELIIPKLIIPERNQELEKRISILKNKLANKEYRRMTKNVDFTSRFKAEDSVGYQIKQINSGLIGVFQFVLSIACAFLFGFMGIDVFFGLTLELAVRLLLGIIFALIVGGAELYFLAKNLDFSDSDYIPSSPSVSSKKPAVVVGKLKSS